MKLQKMVLVGSILLGLFSLYLWNDNKAYQTALGKSPEEILEESTLVEFQVVGKSEDEKSAKIADAGLPTANPDSTHVVSFYYGKTVHSVLVSEAYYNSINAGDMVSAYYYPKTSSFILEYNNYKN